MPAAVRIGDLCSGHACYPPRANIQGSSNVLVNSIGWHRMGEQWLIHCCITPVSVECHTGVMVGGSSSVFVNGIAVARVGDSISCGSVAMMGSSNVYAGG